MTLIISGVAERVMHGVCDGESCYTEKSYLASLFCYWCDMWCCCMWSKIFVVVALLQMMMINVIII